MTTSKLDPDPGPGWGTNGRSNCSWWRQIWVPTNREARSGKWLILHGEDGKFYASPNESDNPADDIGPFDTIDEAKAVVTVLNEGGIE